jgi:Pyridine nucleotide-disulphide oxidoreductase
MESTHRVVILGGGFGGLYAAKALKKAPLALTVLDRRNFHLFQPLLYQVATGSLSPGEIASPLRAVLRRQQNTQVLLAEAMDLDAGHRKVILDSGELEYDTLIVATGSTDSYFGHDDWKRIAPGLKSIEEATEIRHKILYAFEAAEKEHDPQIRREWLTFVLVGGGPTGVELAGALGEIAHDTLRRDFRSIRPQEAVILLVEGGPRVLPTYPADLSAKAEASLVRLGVTVRSNAYVTGIEPTAVTVKTSTGVERIAASESGLQSAGAFRDLRDWRSRPLGAGRQAASGSGSGGHARRRLRRETDSETAPGRERSRISLLRQREPGRDRPRSRGGANRQAAYVGPVGLAHLALRPPDVPGGVFKPGVGLHSLGLFVFDVQPRRALDYGRRSHG